MTKGLWVKIRTRRHHSPAIFMGKPGWTWGNYFTLSPIKSEQGNEK